MKGMKSNGVKRFIEDFITEYAEESKGIVLIAVDKSDKMYYLQMGDVDLVANKKDRHKFSINCEAVKPKWLIGKSGHCPPKGGTVTVELVNPCGNNTT